MAQICSWIWIMWNITAYCKMASSWWCTLYFWSVDLL